jgi:MOSC domain-containing protein YiiM
VTEGQVFSINCSPGGVPKYPVPEAFITKMGLFGDSQANRKFHGGPERAVSLFSLERIRALQEEGHPIGTGTTGENLTLAGIDWDLVIPGAQITTGDAILLVTRYTTPCRTIRESFLEEKFTRMSQKLFPGWSRVYASVIREGMVRTGDRATLVPEGMEAAGWLDSLIS